MIDERKSSPDASHVERSGAGTRPVPQPACASCRQPIWDVYYEVNGQVACERCKHDLELAHGQSGGVAPFVRATLYGIAAGAVGAGIWYAVRAVSGYEVGLIAIVVGLLVGGAVRKGSKGRGGWPYQALAMFLTYSAIVSTYVPMIVKEFMDKAKITQTASPTPASSPAPATAPAAPAAVPASEALPPPPALSPAQALLAVVLFLVVVFLIAFVAPFLAGFQNIMGIVIIGIGLYEAWKINQRVPFRIEGPHRLGAPPQGA